jgi:hypothetical protein
MSLFAHLVERAMDRDRAILPRHDVAPGPMTRSDADPSPGFEEIHVEVPAAGSSSVHPGVPAPARRSARPTSEREPTRPERPASVAPPSITARRDAAPVRETSLREPARPAAASAEVHPAESAARRPASPSSSTPIAPVRVVQRSQSPEPSRAEPIVSRSSVTASQASVRPIEPVRPIAPVMPAPPVAPRLEPLANSTRVDSSPRGPSSDAPPTLRISIGRVIVHAQPPAPTPRAANTSERTNTSLADYLAGRERGER